ncbi:MAG: MFS transporter [Myxococcaceae bacterium]|jgi:OPA family glycerol-3-phosphate transporter-like MFS transporter|nr:MFS transporter [Myxococcaceae bacterium]MCA3012169.1 MFS transporter [Myxococcaceae bacterium]
MPGWLSNLIPIGLLLAVIALVLWRLPQVDLGHSAAFKRRRFWNWFPLGLTYAFLYFGRYNVNALTSALGSKTDNKAFGIIFAAGTLVYGVSFVINGPLTDKLGGRITTLLSAGGAAVANLLMAALVYLNVDGGVEPPGGLVLWLAALYALDMYFQSFGAVSIVKVNAAWFHVRERGVQGGVFGILISLGIYFGYDWSRAIAKGMPTQPWLVALIPGVVLVGATLLSFFTVRDTPGDTGHPDFDVGDASSADTGAPSVVQVFVKMLTNPVILVIVAIEFCTGFLRNGVMSWYPKFAEAVSISDDFVSKNWGLLLCCFGIVGGMMAGVISDKVFHSRRGPVASVLYGGITLGAIAMYFALTTPAIGWVLVFMALNYVGVHGMLSGTASADFGGKKNTGVAVGIIDGFVYLGTGLQSLLVGFLLPQGEAAKTAANWSNWPLAMVPVAIAGLVLCTRVWNAKPRGAASH